MVASSPWTGPGSGARPSERIRINDLRDGSARFLPLDTRFDSANLLDWAVDGQSVLVRVWEKRQTDEKQLGALAWISVSNGAIRPLMVLDPPGGPIAAFQSPDGRWVAVREGAFFSAPTLILSSDGGEKRELLPAMDSASLVGWSPGGEHLLFSKGGDVGALMAVRVDRGESRWSSRRGQAASGIQESGHDDGRQAVLLERPRATREAPRNIIRTLDTFGRTGGALSPSDVNYIDLISWSPDGKALAYIGRRALAR